MTKPQTATPPVPDEKPGLQPAGQPKANKKVREIGGPKGPEPTRYGDWEKKGRCIDF